MAKNLSLFSLFLFSAAFVPCVICSSFHRPTPRLCDASDESSEELCPPLRNPVNINRREKISSTPWRSSSSDFDVHFILYAGKNIPQTFDHSTFDTVKPMFIPDAPLKVLIHGFLNNAGTAFPTNVRDAYLSRSQSASYPEKYNVLVYDWGNGACASVSHVFNPYAYAAKNVEIAGNKLGNMLVTLVNANVTTTRSIHLIGHSLGSHVAGIAARRFYDRTRPQTLLARITALDPAGPGFWREKVFTSPLSPYPRIHRNRAQFLDVYHTSGLYGGGDEIGDIDFYVNGGLRQPSCDIEIFGHKFTPRSIFKPIYDLLLQACCHNYATDIFAKSILDDSMRGCTGCVDYNDFNHECVTVDTCDYCEDKPVLGEFVTKETLKGTSYPLASGVAYINTTRDVNVGSNYIAMMKSSGFFQSLLDKRNILCL